MKVLIAEDDLTQRTILQALLAKWGHQVVAAEDGEQAWDVLRQPQAPRLAVLDWQMPRMTGPELCERLRRQASSDPTYVILLTAREGSDNLVEGLGAGADDYVAKPYDNDELRARLNVGRRVLEMQRSLVEKEKMEGVLEMAGAVCHELNQPLQAVLGWVDLIAMKTGPDDPHAMAMENIGVGVERIAALIRKITSISQYETMAYLDGKIIDIGRASSPGDEVGSEHDQVRGGCG